MAHRGARREQLTLGASFPERHPSAAEDRAHAMNRAWHPAHVARRIRRSMIRHSLEEAA
jgi:hypothetical protein